MPPAVAALVAAASAALSLPVANKTVPIAGYRCGGNQTAMVLYPDDAKRYPLVAFAHGLNAWDVPLWFPQLLNGMAARGYVVVAQEAGLFLCPYESADQIRSLEWAAQDPELRARIDASKGTGLVGHSLGGGATITSAANASAVAAHDVRVAAAMHPAPAAGNPTVPILYLTGDADTVVDPTLVEQQYNAAHDVEKVFAEVKGSSHTDATGWPWLPPGCSGSPQVCNGANREDVYTYDWLDCKLRADQDACRRVTTCAQPSLPVAGCHYDAGPSR